MKAPIKVRLASALHPTLPFPPPTNNQIFLLRQRADRAGRCALVKLIDRYLQSGGADELAVIVDAIDIFERKKA